MDFSSLPFPKEVQSRILQFSQAPTATLVKNRTQEIERGVDRFLEKIALSIQIMERKAEKAGIDVHTVGETYTGLVYIRDTLSNPENKQKIVNKILSDTYFREQLGDQFDYAVNGITSDNFVEQYVNGTEEDTYGRHFVILVSKLRNNIRKALGTRRGGKSKHKRNTKRTKRVRKHNKSRRHRK